MQIQNLHKVNCLMNAARCMDCNCEINVAYLPVDTGLWLSGDKKRTSFGADSLELSDMELERRDRSPTNVTLKCYSMSMLELSLVYVYLIILMRMCAISHGGWAHQQ